ncbi:uncharacterized protein G2W53_040843 [Senna tora]|uniref:Uncharacterized protein n=1 Tax=Senna tora TaxID=362788 RepID=A0A834SE80_9FABA|nr:uncharacterized protein G2W53_040843 [Senna tora]
MNKRDGVSFNFKSANAKLLGNGETKLKGPELSFNGIPITHKLTLADLVFYLSISNDATCS